MTLLGVVEIPHSRQCGAEGFVSQLPPPFVFIYLRNAWNCSLSRWNGRVSGIPFSFFMIQIPQCNIYFSNCKHTADKNFNEIKYNLCIEMRHFWQQSIVTIIAIHFFTEVSLELLLLKIVECGRDCGISFCFLNF